MSLRLIPRLMLLVALAGGAAPPLAADSARVRWTAIRTDEVAALNVDLAADLPTADVGIYYPSNLDPAFAAKLSVDDLLIEFRVAKGVFRAAGVQLKLLWVKTGRVDPQYLEITANDLGGRQPGSSYVNLYESSLRAPSLLTAEARAAFESIVERGRDNHRTVYLVVLQDVFMNFFEQVDERTWLQKTIRTGGLSFPTYSYTTLPRRLRGIISLDKTDAFRRVMAHELGHKLMNVSHEYREQSPQHEIRGDGGLMLYGQGTEIPAGKDGRWHRERLLLSPFLYRLGPDGRRRWNADYREGGHYYDPIYGDHVVRFGAGVAP